MARVYRILLQILAVLNLVVVSLNLVLPLVGLPVNGTPTPAQAILIYIYFGTFTWPILTGLILLLNVFKPSD
ncbi:MAG: hypothetical protein ACFE89_12960 [Candidatus Hodarchaeota archaeon]